MTKPGLVSLVGAGPGDPGLITVKGLERLREADVVIYDRLANPALLSHCRPDAEIIDAGKGRDAHGVSQEEINMLLVDRARQGRLVCRLKGGDPFIFGRGGEEALACAHAAVPWEIVPGVTSAIAAPAYAGIPATHRGKASSVTIVTGSEESAHHEWGVDWAAVAKAPGTIVILMGWEGLPRIADALIAGGVPSDRPAAVIQWGTLPRQRSVSAPLGQIARVAAESGLGSPAVVVIGDVASLREQLPWFEARPLFGKRVLVTRATSQAGRLTHLLESQGAECVQLPAIAITPVADHAPTDAAIARLSRHNSASGMGYDWLTFASPNGVSSFRLRLEALGLDTRALHGVRFAAVGPATAESLASMGVRAEVLPDEYGAEPLVEALRRSGLLGGRVVHFRSSIGLDTLPEGLRALGASVDEVVAYENAVPGESRARASEVFSSDGGGIDVTTFASPSAVRNLVALLGSDGAALVNATTVACIGPATALAARGAGIRADAVASEQTLDGLVDAIIKKLSDGAQR